VPLSFSEDGETLLVGSDLPGSQQLYLAHVDGGELEPLTQFDGPVSGQLLHGGRVLLAKDEGGNERTQLYLLDAREGAEPEPLVVDERYIHGTPHIGRDGELLAYATNRRNGRDFDVVARTLATGEERTFELGGYCGVVAISPDGRWIVADRVGELSGDSDLFCLDVDSGEIVRATPHDGQAEYLAPVWLADSSGFLAATNEGRDTLALGRFDLANRRWTIVHQSRWDLDCAGDDAGRNLLLLANEDGWSTLTLHDPQTLEQRAEVPLPGRGVVDQVVFAPDGSRFAFAYSSPLEPRDVYVYDFDSDSQWPSRLTHSSPQHEPSQLARPTLHRFESFDGEQVPVFLFAPGGAGPFPVVVTVHGGPEAQWRPWFSPAFAPLTQHLVSRGYAVAAPNVRGSTGYGKRYEHLDDVRLRLDSVRDLAALHAWLSARPEIDGSRAAVYGRSYGGYMVLAALAFQPQLWAAGLEAVGIASLVTFLENTSDYRRAAREREYGSLTHDHDFLVEASPLTHVDAIRAPLFIQHGRNDPRVPVSESEQIHAVLTEKGIPCELLVFEDEGHTVEKIANRVETFTRAVAFLERVLGEGA
jgi:dipeptidyl aminopeptidase/acylaminoacyl peptidase